MATSKTSIQDLAAKVQECSETFVRYLHDNSIPEPTFAADSPTRYSSLSTEGFLLQQTLLDALNDLSYLVQGPSESIFNYVHNCIPDATALNVLNTFDFWSAVPLNGSASLAEIAKHTSLPEPVVRRLMEHATTLRIFAETEPGKPSSRIEHTSRSAALAQSPGLRALVSTILDDVGAPMMVLNEALKKYSLGKSDLPKSIKETSFALYHSGDLARKYGNSWELLENDGEGERKGWRQANFVAFMNYLKEIFRLEAVVLEAYDWKAAGKATVVDVGGSGGHDNFVLAQKYQDLTIVVQDLPNVQPVFEANVPEELKSRVTFMAHDFFQPQTTQADIYMIKLILHDWPDEESVKILKGLVPGLKPGAKIVFIDYVGKQAKTEGPALPRTIQQMGTSTDLRMMAIFNAEERPVEAWTKIFRAADERFEITRVEANPLTFYVVIEAVWRD